MLEENVSGGQAGSSPMIRNYPGFPHGVSGGMIGGEPHTGWLSDQIARDARGYLITGRDLLEQPGVHSQFGREPLSLETSMPGVFAVGDGATVVRLVHEYLREYEHAHASAIAPG